MNAKSSDIVKRLLLVSRPISWLNTAYPFAAGYLTSGGAVNAVFVVATLFFLIPYNLLMYGVNDVFDYESDIRNPRKGGIEGMREQRALHPVILRVSCIASLPFVAVLLCVGPAAARLTLLALVFFVVAYSVRGLRFKEKPVLDSITSSLHFVGPLVYALTLTSSLLWSSGAWIIVLAFFVWGLASHAFGAVQDIIPDREGGLRSVATFFGARATVIGCIVLYVIAAVLVGSQGRLAAIIGVVGLLYAANIAPYATVTDTSSGRTNRAWRRFIWLNLFAGFAVTLVLLGTTGAILWVIRAGAS